MKILFLLFYFLQYFIKCLYNEFTICYIFAIEYTATRQGAIRTKNAVNGIRGTTFVSAKVGKTEKMVIAVPLY